MKRFLLFIFLVVSIFCSYSRDELIFRVSEYPPYYFQENGSWRGVSVELMNVLLKEAGYNISYKEIPWNRALMEMKSGKIDAMANLSITKERGEFIHFVGPQMDETMALFINEDLEYEIDKLDDITNIPGKIGIQLGVSYGEDFDNKIESDVDFGNKFVKLSDGNIYGMMLKKKRINAFILNRYVFYYKQSTNDDFKGIIEHPFIVNQDNIFFGFSKHNFTEEQIILLQEAYIRVKERGDFEKILKKYKSPSL